MDGWTVPQILDLAPDAGSRKAGQSLGRPGLWQGLGRSGMLAWGEIKGSGAAPYKSALDLSGPVFRCTCPSRKFPCKHGLGLFLALEAGGAAEASPPDWVAEWAAKRSAPKAAPKEGDAPPKVDAKAQERRQRERDAKVSAGVEELDLWMRDLLRRGLAGARSEPFAFWDRMGARLVDAQATGLARRVRALPGLLARSEDAGAVAALGRLHLLVQGWRNQGALPEPLQAELRAAIGFTATADDAPGVEGRWTVLAQATAEEDKLLVRSTWLASAAGRPALVLDFAAGGRPMAPGPGPGHAFVGSVAFYPGTAGLRAVVRDGAPAPAAPFGGAGTVADALDAVADALGRAPWLEQWPVLLRGVRFARVGGGLAATDGTGVLPLAASPMLVPMVSVAGGGAVEVFGTWDGQRLDALALGREGRLFAPPAQHPTLLRRVA